MTNLDSKYLKVLEPGEGFPFSYLNARLDRNALYALNCVFSREKNAQIRTKYHRAKLTLDTLREDLLEFAVPKSPRRHTDVYNAIFESVDRDIFGDSKCIPLTHGAVATHPALPYTKSPGLPYKLQSISTKREALETEGVLKNIRQMWYAIERREDVTLPDVACYARAQICDRENNKVRATWGYPLDVFLTEGQYFYPLLDIIKTKARPKVAYGIEIGNGGMHYINDMLHYYNKANYFVGDWSKFDKTIPAWLIRDAFKMMARHIDFM